MQRILKVAVFDLETKTSIPAFVVGVEDSTYEVLIASESEFTICFFDSTTLLDRHNAARLLTFKKDLE